MAEQTAGDYIVLGKLGSGAFGTVYQGRHQWQGSTVALKRLNLQNSEHIETARRELQPLLALRSTPHFNVVMFWEAFVDHGSMWLVLEYCDLGTLNDFILATPQNYELNLRLMTNITAAVTFLHDREIVHRDLKPENILLSGTEENPVAKVGDFGLAKVCSDAFPNIFTDYYMSEECGTYVFVAPEVSEGRYTKKCDIFAMGVIFTAMVTRSTRRDDEGTDVVVVVVTENGRDVTIGEALRRNPDREPEIAECLANAMLENTDNRALVAVCLRLLRCDFHMRPTASEVHEDMKQLQRGVSQVQSGRSLSLQGALQTRSRSSHQADPHPTHSPSEGVERLRQIQQGRRGRGLPFRAVRGRIGQRRAGRRGGRGALRNRAGGIPPGGQDNGQGDGAVAIRPARRAQGRLRGRLPPARGRSQLRPALRVRQISRNFPGGIQGFFAALKRRVGEHRARRVISRFLDFST